MSIEELKKNEQIAIRIEKLEELKREGRDPFLIEKFPFTHKSEEIKEKYDSLEDQNVSASGRIVLKRGQGKTTFLTIQDDIGRIQIYVKQDLVGEEEYHWIKKFDIGDIIGVNGTVFKTKTGEISVRADKVLLLTKSIRPLPDKHKGLQNIDLRYRHRYVDLISNPDVKEAFLKRNKAIKAIKSYLDERDFIEVDTPSLNTIAGGATARPFITHHNTLDIDMYLRIANELYLKRLIVGGFEKVYEMGKMFRNEGMDVNHNPEYTAIEVYEAYVDLDDIMDLTEGLVRHAAKHTCGSAKVSYQGKTIDFSAPFEKISMLDVVKKHTQIDFNEIHTDEDAQRIAKEKGLELEPAKDTWGHILNQFFEEFCEDKLIQPTFITGHPVVISPLAKKDANDERITRRFELFANGWELANAFSELNDPIDQRERFEAQVQAREDGDDEAQRMDEDFLNAIETGLPPTGGMGMGVDRLIMLLTDAASIRDVILFPTMKPLTDTGLNEEE